MTQCQLLGLSRSGWYATAVAESALNQELRGWIDQEYTAHPFYGSRRMTTVLRRAGYPVNRKRDSVDDGDGVASDLSETGDVDTPFGSSDLPLSAAGSDRDRS